MVGEPVPSNNKTTVYEGESKGRPAGGRVKSAGKAQRYGPILGLAVANRQAGFCCAACGLVRGSKPGRQAWAKQRLQRHPF